MKGGEKGKRGGGSNLIAGNAALGSTKSVYKDKKIEKGRTPCKR